MNIIAQSSIVPETKSTISMSVLIRERPASLQNTRFVVHYENHSYGGFFTGLYTDSEDEARAEYAVRCERIGAKP